jgi:glycine hydroxymethyltransferase
VRPKILIAGASAYSRNYDYARMREIADSVGAYLLSDMAHISGLVAGDVVPTPFEHSDVVTTTTHKTLRGPRGAMIFYRKGVRSVDKKGRETMYDLEDPINFAVFPGCQGGPHNHTITALATALKQAASPEFKGYMQEVVANSQSMADAFSARGYSMVSGGTDNHLLLLDVMASRGVDGARCEFVLERCNISTNKNTVPTDQSALKPSGLRLGSPTMTSRGLVRHDFAEVADFVDRGVLLAKEIADDVVATTGKKSLKQFKESLAGGAYDDRLHALRDEVADFCRKFPTIGFDAETMKYKGKTVDA